ncbi:MAG: ribonuclease D [Geobacter sp.]|nr:ribonuclease D [Geobacter sp.]
MSVNTPEIITTSDALLRLVNHLQGEPVVAFDLEADSMHHYQEKVCLIQVSTTSENAIIDPLALDDLSPLGPILADSGILKVMHGADYDIRSFHRDFGFEVRNLFDTMIASQFLGEKEIGLAAQLRKRFGVELDKRYQRADWSRRPLEPGMIAYATEDTGHLILLYLQMTEGLKELGRLEWVEEECALLCGVRSAVRDPNEPMFLRFKGASRMDGRTLAVLEELLRFRDRMAEMRDRPLFMVLSHDAIRIIAEQKPADLAALKRVGGLSPRQLDRYGMGILEGVARGMDVPEHLLPAYPRHPRVKRNQQQETSLKALKEWRERKAAELRMDAGILMGNSQLEALVASEPLDLAILKRWQRRELGDELLSILQQTKAG